MYEDNRDQGFDGNVTPDHHRVDENVPNFIMKEPENQPGQSQEPAQNQDQFRGKQEPERLSPAQSQDSVQPYGPVQSQSSVRLQGPAQSYGPSQSQSPIQPQNSVHSQGTGGYTSTQGPDFAGGDNRGYQGTGYQNPPYGQMGGSPAEPVDHGRGKKAKKGGKMVRKAAGFTAAALLFGVISGGTMVGVNMLADSMKEEIYPQVSQSETVGETQGEPSAVPPEGIMRPDSFAGGQASSALAMDVSAIVENAMPSIVAINNTMLYESGGWPWGPSQTYEVPSSGSGIIVGQNEEELLIVTNNHVVEDANNLSVVFIDSTPVDAAIKGTDADSDLAVIAVPLKDIPADTLSQITVATLGNSDDLKMGQSVIAIGNALGHGQSVTVGWISALDREVTTEGTVTRNLLQTDAAINPGNSGGALLNMKGEVVGINAAKYSSTEVEGIGYAIPISKAQDIINSLMTKRTRNNAVEEGKEGYLGIQGITVDDSMARQLGMPSGVFVSGIIEDGAASRTDLREKDIITKFDDQTVRTMAALQDLLKYYREGETVTMTVQSLENGQYVERTIEITLGGRATLGDDNQVSQGRRPRN